jgi:hypothetical protein
MLYPTEERTCIRFGVTTPLDPQSSMRLDGLENMHFRHIKIQADRLPDCDLGIHHG